MVVVAMTEVGVLVLAWLRTWILWAPNKAILHYQYKARIDLLLLLLYLFFCYISIIDIVISLYNLTADSISIWQSSWRLYNLSIVLSVDNRKRKGNSFYWQCVNAIIVCIKLIWYSVSRRFLKWAMRVYKYEGSECCVNDWKTRQTRVKKKADNTAAAAMLLFVDGDGHRGPK